MTPEARKQLEEMAGNHAEEVVRGSISLPVKFRINEDKCSDFMAGAQAAWDLAVKHERERVRKLETLLDKCVTHMNESGYHWDRKYLTDMANQILNPRSDDADPYGYKESAKKMNPEGQ